MTEVRLFLCGDVMLGRGIDQILPHANPPDLYEPHVRSATTYLSLAEAANGPIPRHAGPAYVWGDALAVLRAAAPDARIVNLETAITASSQPWPKGINYRMHPDNVGCLTAARIDCCMLANNHVLDWGEAGLLDTLSTLRRAGIARAGAGRNAAEAAAPAVLPLAGGARVLVFGYASSTSGVPQDWAAGAGTPGVDLLPDLSARTATRIAEAAQAQRQARDLLIASVHWGGNWGHDIPAPQRTFAHALVDGGFDVVHGHSSHHAKGIEAYRQKLVLYGCGDFINDYEGISGYEEFRADLVVIYLPRLDGETGRLLSLEMVPMQIRRFRLNRPSAQDAKWLHDVLARESARLGTVIALHADDSFSIMKGGL
ncbi:CapA family protein [Limobrevibacterium gyesilva]|uniref:CapA family protein n=1 Tax=Limobrevibacterium gyesilva TaxID=2991712 RepID=A0AA41YMA2_9PROT|nr:CapA family protein [Limobrevibacterium gyesilva]MCW3474583.1 CapA family protein [Limobrevibacterium gyesilva]